MSRSTYILLLLLCIVCGSLNAQPRLERPEVYLGAHAGVMASSVLFDPAVAGIDLLQSPLSVNGGLVFRYVGHKVCALQVELNYMQRGWREVGDGVDYRRQLDYLELPLLMQLYFGKQHFRAFLNLGPQVGYCIRDVEYGQRLGQSVHQYEAITNRFDWGLAGGLGVCYRTNRIGLFQLEARFNYSLGSIFGNKLTDHFEMSNPMGLSVNLAYLWEFKNRK